ncbi:MAG: tandem-95 repeat protein, partial [Rhizobiaceae bacterium]
MAGSFQSIFNRKPAVAPENSAETLVSPVKDKPLMRVLEPRILLDAAAVETALDIAGQAAHSQLADDYMENAADGGDGGGDGDGDAPQVQDAPPADDDIAESLASAPRRTDREIVFVDASIEDREGLIASLEPGVSVHIIDSDSDGVQQMADLLAQSGGYDAVHIFSHGSQGALQLGNGVLDASSIGSEHADALAQIRDALSENGDILIYGCNFGEGDLGQRTAGLLAAATGADIAASDDLTGSESLSGDWDLEVQHGQIESRSFTLPDWQGILPGYELQPSGEPTIGHLDDGIVGTSNTTATWSDAVVFDPGGGGPIQTFDIRATLIGMSDGMSATFETVASTDGSMDDFRVIVTNIGAVVGSAGGQDIVEEGSVAVRWAIYEAGTETLAPPDQFNLIFKDIEGLAGTPETRETVAVESEEIVSYTVNAGSDLQISSGYNGLTATGTELGTGAVGSDLGLSWVSANQFVVTYTSRTLITNFDMDGDRDMSAFPTPETTKTQLVDLNGAAAGEDYVTTYINGSQMGSDDDVPLTLTDVNMSIFDFDGEFLQSATVTLTNASSGDDINFDPVLLGALGISASYTDTGTERILQLSGFALISNYETALQSISYSNSNADGSFDQVTDRIFEFSVFDGVITSDIAQTTVQFATAAAAPVAGTNVYVEDEDTTIVANVATGLLSNDSDPQGASLTIIGAMDSDSIAIPIGAAHTMPSGASLTLNSNGSFTYIPALNYSGNETISYSISDGVNSASGIATFNIQPVIDAVTLNVIQPDNVSAEDVSSDPVDISATSDDPSEQQIILATDIPEGVVLTDGLNFFTAGDGLYEMDITDWDRTQLRVLPVQNSDEDIDIIFVTENFEVDGSISFDSQTVTFHVDAVADMPILIVEQAFGDIDENVPLGDVISVDLFDTDGSEAITDITISGIPAGAQMIADSGPLTIVGGSVSFALLDLPGLIFSPPITGTDAVYNLSVSATSTEVAAENGIETPSATRFGIGLTIELNDNDNPVVAVDDAASTFAGESVSIYVLDNDFIPDGAPLITHVNGIAIDTVTPVTLPGGQGDVELSPFGYLVFNASATFAGEVKFSYTAQDADLSTDDGIVTVSVEPRWRLSSVPNVVEGDSARFILGIEGGVAQGDVISAEVILEEGSTDASDHAALADAINDSIINLGQTDFSFDGTNITYTAPATNYTANYNPTAGTFLDISATGDALNLGDDGITGRSIGFDFSFYADTFSSVFVSANGYLTFGSPGADANNASLDGTALSGRPIIAPFWDDLNTASGNVYIETIGAIEGQRQFVIQWDGVQNASDGSGTGSFQVVLDEAGNAITFNYQDVVFDGVGDNGAGATIGLQSPDGVADEFSFNDGGNIVDGSSITFTREANVNVELYIDVPIVDDAAFEDEEDFNLRIVSAVNSAIGVDTSTVTISVSDNSAPVAVDDSVATTETSTALINVITNPGGLDFDPEGHALQISELDGVVITGGTAVTLASGATVGVNPNGSLTYNPNGAFAHLEEGELSTDTFTYKVVDAYGTESTTPATVTVNITGENQTAVIDLNDDGTTSDTTHNVTYGPLETTMNVTAPDAVILDVDDTELSSISITLGGFMQPGNEKIRTGGLIIEYGTALSATKSQGGTLFRIDYDGVNDIQITNNFGPEFSVADAQDLIRGLLYENDSSDDTRGTRTLTFVATDDDGPGTSAVSEIYVVGNNVAPDAGDDGVPTPYQTIEDTSILITVAELLSNDSDVDFNPLDIIAVNGGANGSAILDGSGNVIYTPTSDFTGSTFFTYTLDDGEGGQDTGTVYVDVTPVNDAPRIDLNGLQPGIDNTITYIENDPATSMFLLTGTVIDVDNANLTGADIVLTGGQIDDVFNFGTLPAGISATLVPAEAATGLTAPATVTIQLTGTASVADYEIALRGIGFSNLSDLPDTTPRSVAITATDGLETSLVATATINVQQVNDVPDTVDDGLFTFDEDTSLTIAPATLLANDSDKDGEALTIISVQSPINGSVITDGFGDFVFTPNPNYFGPASFTYTVEDESGATRVQLVRLDVTSVNDAPVITLDTGSGDGNYAFTYTENDPATDIVAATLDLQDIDHANLASATVTLTNGQVGDLLEHGTMPAGITASIVPPTALTSAGPITVALSGSAPLADYEAALKLVTYRSMSEAPSVVNRTLSISVNDGDDDSNVGTTTVTVIAVNDAPIAADDNSLTLNEDSARIILPSELLANDIDPDFDTISIVSVQSPVNGTVVLNGDDTITFTPATDYFGPASFTYTIDDGNGEQDTATVNLTINSVNDRPVVDLDTGTGGADFATTYLENDPAVAVVDPTIQITDVDHSSLASASVVLTNGQIGDQLLVGSLPAGITSSISPSGALTTAGTVTVTLTGGATLADYETALQAVSYVSLSDDPGNTTRTLDISVNDGTADSVIATTSIAVTPVNDDPVANADGTYSFNEDTNFVIGEAGLLANDSDIENDTLTILSVQNPVNGTVSLLAGVVTFTPDVDYSGPASFEYTVDDGNGGSDTAIVSLTVNAVNDAPDIDLDAVAAGTGFSTTYIENGTPVGVVDASVVITDVDGSTYTQASLNLTGGQIGDILNVGALPAGITAVVTPSSALTAAGPINVQLTGTANAADYQAALQAITFESLSDNPGATARTIAITVSDGTDTSTASLATINVTPVNDVPDALPDGVYTFNEDEVFTLPEATLLANDTDADGDTLIISSVQSAVNGSVALDGFGNVVFTPTPTYSGPASFTYTTRDPSGATDTTTVSLNILILNDAPIVDLDASAPGSGYATSYTENGIGIAIVDSDVSISDEDHLTAASASVTLTNGQIGDLLEAGALPGGISASIVPSTALTSPGTITVTLSGVASLADYQSAFQALTYRSTSEDPDTTNRVIEFVVSDGEDDSITQSTTITVSSVNDAPFAVDDGVPTPISVTEDVPVLINPVASNDYDFEGDTLTITEIDGNAIVPGGFVNVATGRVDLALDGVTLTYSPTLNFFGPATFTYTLSDGALTDTANVNLDVVPVNDAPIALDDGPVVLVEDGSVFYDPVLSNDSDVEGDTLLIEMIDGQAIAPTGSVTIASGTITLGADGRTLQYVPNPDFNGAAVISYVVGDGQATATANVTFDVTAVDDPITLVTTPPDLAFNDSDPVSLPMAGYFDDPDADALVYTISGLPIGLSYDSATGLISGVLDSSASQSSPYSVTVSVDDGVSSIVSTGFTLDVVNIAPVATVDQTLVVQEGDTLNVDTAALFTDADNDTLTYAASGLPAWV